MEITRMPSLVGWMIMLGLVHFSDAMSHAVGDVHGWAPATDGFFSSWATDQNFRVSDTLVFESPAGPPLPTVSVPSSQVPTCNTTSGVQLASTTTGTSLIFNITEASSFGFIATDPYNCHNQFMSFVVQVSPTTDGSSETVGSGPSYDGPEAQATSDSAKNGFIWVTGLVAGAAAVFFVAMALAAVRRIRHMRRTRKCLITVFDSPSFHSKEFVGIEWPWGPRRFSYNELSVATKCFSSSEILGEGGFGTVYKGVLPESGAAVAVKRLSPYARQGAREFIAEVSIISQLRHRNLVQLLGWCDDEDELVLVYEYMPNGDLDELIYGEALQPGSVLAWKQRYNILTGVATALVYLHEEWEQRVVHRDVKTSNVMLDSQFNARLGDFGLARLSAHSQTPRTTLVAGTIGYLAPEFNLTGRATDKTDVYAFGVVVLEVSCARRPLTSNCILVDWVWELHTDEKLLDAIDPKLEGRSHRDEEEMILALQVGLLCSHPDPNARPCMRLVLNILTGETPLPKLPRSKPVAHFGDEP